MIITVGPKNSTLHQVLGSREEYEFFWNTVISNMNSKKESWGASMLVSHRTWVLQTDICIRRYPRYKTTIRRWPNYAEDSAAG